MSRPAFRLPRAAGLSMGFALLALHGCALGPDYERPQTPLPENYRNTALQTEVSLADQPWRDLFTDPQLQQLIDRALQQNRDLAIAAQRVIAARANAGASGLARLPQLDAGGSAVRNRLSTRGSNATAAAIEPHINLYEAGIDASFELDLWGRLSRLSEAAQARWQASVYDRQTVQITLISDVARAYFALQNLDRQRSITRDTIATRERSAGLIRTRHDAGAVSGLDVGQAEAELAAARAAVPNIQRQIEAAESALRILLGAETDELV
ncbi:MAG: TolC family protein, partial [Spongiibacteraceae bacterium]